MSHYRKKGVVFPLTLLALAATVDTVSAQIPARVETAYTLMDAESRRVFEVDARCGATAP